MDSFDSPSKIITTIVNLKKKKTSFFFFFPVSSRRGGDVRTELSSLSGERLGLRLLQEDAPLRTQVRKETEN